MENFEERRKKLIEKVNSDPFYIEVIKMDDKCSKDFKRLLLEPNTEKELEVAQENYDMVYNIFNLGVLTESTSEHRTISYDSLEYANLMSEFISAFKNKDDNRVNELKNMMLNYLGLEFYGKLFFQSCYLDGIDENCINFKTYLFIKCGFNQNDSSDILCFNNYYMLANKVIINNIKIMGLDKSLDINEESLERHLRISRGFNKGCSEFIKHSENLQMK